MHHPLERLKKSYSQFGARILGPWRGFGKGAGLKNTVTEPKRGWLPHGDKPGLIQFITFRLWDSMPASRRGEWEHLLSANARSNAPRSGAQSIALRERRPGPKRPPAILPNGYNIFETALAGYFLKAGGVGV